MGGEGRLSCFLQAAANGRQLGYAGSQLLSFFFLKLASQKTIN